MTYRRQHKDKVHSPIVDAVVKRGKVAFDCSGLSGLGFDVVLHGSIAIVEDMKRANAAVDAAEGTPAHQLAIMGLALTARQFLRQYANGMAIGFLPCEFKTPTVSKARVRRGPNARKYSLTNRPVTHTVALTASEQKARAKAPIPTITSVDEAMKYF